MKMKLHPYQWKENIIQKEEDKEQLSIRAFCLNEESNPVLIRIEDFPVFCFIELPKFVNRRVYNWTHSDAKLVYNYIYNKLDEIYRPIGYKLIDIQKLYYYKLDRKDRVIRIFFNNIEGMKKIQLMLKESIYIEEIGDILLTVWDNDISNVRKLLTAVGDFNICQWFECFPEPLQEEEKISNLKEEYIISWNDIKPIHYDKITNPGILSYDLETYSENIKAFPQAINTGDFIYLNSCVYQRYNMPETLKLYIFIYGDCDPIEGVTIIKCESEIELINKFCDIIRETGAIILTGYNIYGFDNPYLNTRLENNLLQWPNTASIIKDEKTEMVNYTWASSAYGFNSINYLDISGIITIDVLPIVKRDYKFVDYKLDTVSNFFLKMNKFDVKPEEMFKIVKEFIICKKIIKYIEKNPNNVNEEIKQKALERYEKGKKEMTRITSYCVNDSVLVMKLFDKLNIWVGLIALSNTVDVTPMELVTRGQGIRFISQLYNIATKEGYLLDKRNVEPSEYTGAFVFPPVPGLYDNVMCLDFNSLYPSLIIAFNICFTTLVSKELWDKVPKENCNILEWDEEPENDNKIEDPEGEEEDEDEQHLKGFYNMNEDTGELEYVKNIDNIDKKTHYEFRFVKKEVKEGLLPKLVSYLISERKKVKKLMKKETEGSLPYIMLDKKQLALKVNANSIYGILGAQYGGMRSLIEAAKSITAMGRKCILQCNKYLEDKYKSLIVYNDTDSTMFTIPNLDTYEKCHEKAEHLEEEISSLFPPPLKLEMEKIGRMLCIAKKKYAFWQSDKNGLLPYNKKGSVLYKGIILARRDNCKWLRKVYEIIIERILNRLPMQETLNIIVEKCLELYSGKVDIKDLIITQTLGANYKSETCALKIFSELLNSKGNPVQPGDRLQYVIVDTGNVKDKKGFKMRLYELYELNPERIDSRYYLEHYVKNSIEQIWKIAYKDELKKIMEYNEYILYYNIILELINGNPYKDFIINLCNDLKSCKLAFQEIENKYIQDPTMRKYYDNARKKYITGRDKLNIFIDDEPIKLICQGIKKNKLNEVISVLSKEVYTKYF